MRMYLGILLAFVYVLNADAVVRHPKGALVRAAATGSLLQPQSFPKTFNDLSFVDRMDVLSEGYDVLDAEFDENGRCISGCAYVGITLEDELALRERQTQIVVADLERRGLLRKAQEEQQVYTLGKNTMPGGVPAQTTVTTTPVGAVTQPVGPTKKSVVTESVSPVAVVDAGPKKKGSSNGDKKQKDDSDVGGVTSPASSCSQRMAAIPAGQALPIGEPVEGRARISSKFGMRKHPVSGGRKPHNGVDLAVPIGTKVYTPGAGVVKTVATEAGCGKYIKISHDEGYETLYCHLSQHLVKKGERIDAGCLIALSGNTGRSTGPHLHYGIKKSGIYVDPAKLMQR